MKVGTLQNLSGTNSLAKMKLKQKIPHYLGDFLWNVFEI